MNDKLENYLYTKYPDLFQEHTGSMKQTCMCWGCSCGSGWFLLIDQLCQNITNHIKNQHSSVDLYDKWEIKTNEENKEVATRPDWAKEKVQPVVLKQVKEKFGLLRVYHSGGDEKVQAMIDFAEEMSGYVCEICGKFDYSVGYTKGWIKHICQSCADETPDYKGIWNLPDENKEAMKLLQEAREEDEKNKDQQVELAFKKIEELKSRDKSS